jgi:predicted O-linked N-acetylglucosamine transferase (SPINDLY family)
MIRKDGIDILIDLAGHTGYNRMLLFARKPAPVQVSWLGYPNTTGLKTVDYRIVDGYTDPPGLTDPFYTEELIRLPHSFLCYLPDNNSPAVGTLPGTAAGHITFGSFNFFAKVSPEVVGCWAELLKAVPASRILLKTKSLSDKPTREYAMEMFTQKGIESERIELLSYEHSYRGHLDIYNRIDIGLDTFPYNGTTTTCEAIWMGVPVITLAGDRHASRVGVSLLSNIGLPELIAKTEDEYIDIAVKLATDIGRLQVLRQRTRYMMTHSPLSDAKSFTAHLEDCYQRMWEKWCAAA